MGLENQVAKADRNIFHVDMDAFYTSIEQRDNPHYQNKPVIVGAQPGGRGVVAASSYEARKFGVFSAMPINQAFQKCPNGIYLRPNMSKYISVSKQIMKIFYQFTPLVEQISVDEAFLDCTGVEKLWGKPKETAKKIKEKVYSETSLSCSIGIAPNKFLAKLSSSTFKPNKISVTPYHPGEIARWLAPMSLSKIWGVGKKSQEKLKQDGFTGVEQLQNCSLEFLENKYGKFGRSLFMLSRGLDNREIVTERAAKSISHEHSFAKDCSDYNLLKRTLLSLSKQVAIRARNQKLKGKVIVLIFRTSNFKKHTRRKSLHQPTQLTKEIFENIMELYHENIPSPIPIRLIGVALTNFTVSQQESMLFEVNSGYPQWIDSEKAMDKIQDKFGNGSIFYGGEMKQSEIKNH